MTKQQNMMNDFPESTLEQSPRILREEADVIESNASGMGERKMMWAGAEAAGLRYLAALIEIGNPLQAKRITDDWSLSERCRIPSAVFGWMSKSNF